MDLHGKPLKDCVFLHRLDVVDRQPHQKVHDDDRHDQDKDNKESPCSPLVMHHVHLVVVDVVKEEVVVLQLPDGHHKGLDEGEAPEAEVGLVLQQSIEAKGE